MKFKVTSYHINKALALKNKKHKKTQTYCPIALCMQEATGNMSISVGKLEITYRPKFNGRRFPVRYPIRNMEMILFIEDFDNGEPVKPFEFEFNQDFS